MKKLILSGLAMMLLGGLGAASSENFWVEKQDRALKTTQKPAPLPTLPQTLPATPSSIEEANDQWIEHQIKKGESLAGIFSKYDLGADTLNAILEDNASLQKQLTRLYPGKTLKLRVNDQGELESLVYQQSRTDTIAVTKTVDGFTSQLVSLAPERELQLASGTIQQSLFLDGKAAGLSDKLILELTKIFGWDIDFARGLQAGDRFTVLYEKLFIDDEPIGDGAIVAAEFINNGQTYRALRYTLPDGHTDYFTPDGESLRKAFLRTPVKSARITSRFNLKRRHPVLHRIRAHKGVDYAAPTGTPVLATGDGKIIFRGHKGGYGRVIVLDHGQGYTTLYAHLSRFSKKFKTGSRVKQGDVIGFVGKSGLATGPHLHYEFRIHGRHRDPLTVPLPGSRPIPLPLLAGFQNKTAPLLAALDQASPVAIAKAETPPTPP